MGSTCKEGPPRECPRTVAAPSSPHEQARSCLSLKSAALHPRALPSGQARRPQAACRAMEPQDPAIELRLHSVLGLPATGTSVVAEVRRSDLPAAHTGCPRTKPQPGRGRNAPERFG